MCTPFPAILTLGGFERRTKKLTTSAQYKQKKSRRKTPALEFLQQRTKSQQVKTGSQYKRKVTSIGTIVATTLPFGPTAGLNFQPFTASIAFSSSPRPGPLTTEMLIARPSCVIVTCRTPVP